MLTLALVLGSALAAMAAPLENCPKQLESFDFVVDHSGSMLMAHPKLQKIKVEAAKSLITSINDKIPAQDYNAGLHTVAPASTLVPQGAWNRAAIARGVARINSDLSIVGRMTPLGDSLKAHAGAFAAMKPKAAVILFSDGESNRGADPVAAVQSTYQSRSDLVFHIVSFADTPEGKATLTKIAALNKGSVYVEASDLAASEAALDKFVRDVFCAGQGYSAPSGVAQARKQEAAPAAALAPAAVAQSATAKEVPAPRGINFATGSAALNSDATKTLDAFAAQIKSKPGSKVVLNGWTDTVGSDALNAQLSQRRADAAKNYLVKQGVPAASITAVGKGKSTQFDNSTEAGRYKNRRTDVLID